MVPVGVLLLPACLQMLAMAVDEGLFHRRRGLPKWERVGHPLDTLTAATCYAFIAVKRPEEPFALSIYVALAAFSCLFITKDELVHARLCDPREIWLHSLLFVLHPATFLAFGIIWWSGRDTWILSIELALTLAFFVYQLAYWSVPWKRTHSEQQ